ncbi:hypothetical protein ApAK_07505 [Thermoplasmatales archaeon AK]|nr:hypothetical protein [Thermoplasmatales archaeon AK]
MAAPRIYQKADASKSGKRIVFRVREDLASLDADNEIRKGWEKSSK